MKIAHVSDLHLVATPSGTTGTQLEPERVAKAVVDDLNEIAEGLDLVVVSGDLTEHGELSEFALFEDLFSKLDLPVVLVPGNHDGAARMNAHAATSKRFLDWNITDRLVEIGDCRMLGLDTCVEGATEGSLKRRGMELLAEAVQADSSGRLVIVMHHPPLVIGSKTFDGFCALEGQQEFLGILRGAGRSVIVLAGHVHRPYAVYEESIACFVAGSMPAPFDTRLPFGPGPIRPAKVQDFYFVHDIGRNGHHVVTQQRVRDL